MGDNVEEVSSDPSKPPGFSKPNYVPSSNVSMDSNARVNRRVASWVEELNNSMEAGKLMGFQLKGSWEEIVHAISTLRERGGFQ